MATPHIVGLVSLLKQKDPSLTASRARSLLREYPLAVQSESLKYIAQAVDVGGLFEHFSPVTAIPVEENLSQTGASEVSPLLVPETTVLPPSEEIKKSLPETASGETLELIATRDETLVSQENTTQALVIDETQLRAPQKLDAESSILELGNKDETVAINSAENTEERSETLSLTAETSKKYISTE